MGFQAGPSDVACLIGRTLSASQQCFSVTINQSTVILAMIFWTSEQTRDNGVEDKWSSQHSEGGSNKNRTTLSTFRPPSKF